MNERLEVHEMRTQIQPVLGLVQVLTQKRPIKKNYIIITNAKNLSDTSYDILDVTVIESQGLNLNDLITNKMDDIITNRGFANNKIQRNNVIKLLYTYFCRNRQSNNSSSFSLCERCC